MASSGKDGVTIQAWYMNDTDEDQLLPHHRDREEYVSLEKLAELGVLYWHLNVDDYENDEEFNEIRKARGYTYSDLITCSPDKLCNYEAKLKSFFEEHIHTDEEIRFCLEGSGYFDVRDLDDHWIRIWVHNGDMIVLPAGIYHRFTLDTGNYIKVEEAATLSSHLKGDSHFHENPYCKSLENVRDIEFDRVDVEGNAHNGPVVRLPFASLFDTLGAHLFDESSVLLLYSLVHGNSDFLEYVLVRTDLDILLMPVLEMLYDASKRTSNQMYMLLIVLLILSQDSSFNASIHKLMLPNVPWYKERLLHHTSLGSLMVVVLIRTVKYNLSKLWDVYLHTNCLATLANMAPHVHRLSAYASQRLVSLFDMLSRKYLKLEESKNDKIINIETDSKEGCYVTEEMSPELHIYTDFLRIVLEILNAILSYALPRNPEIVYAIMHRQEVFQPFKNHPRFTELLENIYTVLDFFNSRMDAQSEDSEWSVEKVLQVIIINCRSWRGEGMAAVLIPQMFTQLRFTYEQEHHPEEFFIPYVWHLVLSNSGFRFNPSAIRLFPVDLPSKDSYAESAEAGYP